MATATQLDAVLRTASGFGGGFDAFTLAEAAGGQPLAAMGYWALAQSGLLRGLGIASGPLMRWLRAVEAGYNPNPYHSNMHVAHVVQASTDECCTATVGESKLLLTSGFEHTRIMFAVKLGGNGLGHMPRLGARP
jgi:hypothetical protein